MGLGTIRVSPDQMPGKARQIRACGVQVMNLFYDAYELMRTTMRQNWSGSKAYNDVAVKFNDMALASLDGPKGVIKMVVDIMPQALENAANNYTLADRGCKITAVGGDEAKSVGIVPLGVVDGVQLQFTPNVVSSTKDQIITKLKNAEEAMNNLQVIVDSVDWSETTGDSFKAVYRMKKNEIVNVIDNMEAVFTKAINEAQNALEAGNKANYFGG